MLQLLHSAHPPTPPDASNGVKLVYKVQKIFCVYYLLGKGGYVFDSVGLFVSLFVCLSVDNITQKVMNGLG